MSCDIKRIIKNQGIKLYLNGVYPWILRQRVRKVAQKDKIEVVFFAINLAMWRYQGVYELLSREERFNCHIVLTAARQFSQEQRVAHLKLMREYFDALGIPYIDYDEIHDEGYNVKGKINPDILFYPQPYQSQYVDIHCFKNFGSKLICYIPYSVNVAKSDYNLYDMEFHNLAWRIYAPTHIELENAKRIARNHGRNWMLSGYSNLDRYCNEKVEDIWKIKDRTLKRLIWAPHFSITQEVSWLFSRPSFLWLSELMLDLADQNKDRLQIAFKPHPWLKTELYNHPDWGKERTDRYFERWAHGANTQLETGDFVDLFKTSDAMIHDSGSFTAEYLYVNKPVAFVTSDLEGLLASHNDFGKAALGQHYIVKDQDDVMKFVEDVVLGGNDPKASERTKFFNEVLKPNVTGNTSQFIVDDIKRSLGI